MKIKRFITGLLLIFVFFSLSFLFYKELSLKGKSNANTVTETLIDKTSFPEQPITVQENRVAKENSIQPRKADISLQTAVKTPKSKIIAYYFHGTYRCYTCRTIERYSHEAVEKFFSKELQNGTLEFRPVNVETPENRHYIQDYQLFSRSLVLSLNRDGQEIKWKNLEAVWTHVRDREKFYQYVKDEVEGFLKELQ